MKKTTRTPCTHADKVAAVKANLQALWDARWLMEVFAAGEGVDLRTAPEAVVEAFMDLFAQGVLDDASEPNGFPADCTPERFVQLYEDWACGDDGPEDNGDDRWITIEDVAPEAMRALLAWPSGQVGYWRARA